MGTSNIIGNIYFDSREHLYNMIWSFTISNFHQISWNQSNDWIRQRLGLFPSFSTHLYLIKMERQSGEGAVKLVAEVLLVNPLVQFRTIYIYNLLDCLYVCIMYTHLEHNYMYIHMHHVHPHLDILDTWAINTFWVGSTSKYLLKYSCRCILQCCLTGHGSPLNHSTISLHFRSTKSQTSEAR